MHLVNGSSCTICNSLRERCFNELLLGKYNVQYFYCHNCGLLQTEEPYWLEEAYTEAIADADTGLASRNYNFANKLALIIYLLFNPKGTYLDSAGGYGLLTRLMRDRGFDFLWKDIHCENIFARGFEYLEKDVVLSGVTAVEVLEHTPDPLSFVKQQIALSDDMTLIFTTELFSGKPPDREWWYYAFPTGQHISFFQRRTLEYMAKNLGLNLYSHRNWHILTRNIINTGIFRLASSRLAGGIAPIVRFRLGTKTLADHRLLIDKMSKKYKVKYKNSL